MKKAVFGSLIFVGIFNLFFYPISLGIGIPILFLLLNLYLFLVRESNSKYLWLATTFSVLAVTFAAGIAIRANEIVLLVDFLTTLFLTTAAAVFYKRTSPFSFTLPSFLVTPFTALTAGLSSISDFFSQKRLSFGTDGKTDTLNAIFKGIAIAVPVVGVLFLLLLGADPIFRTLASKISFKVSEQLVVSVFIFAILFFWGIAKLTESVVKNASKLTKSVADKLAIESLIVTGAASILFAIFLSIQLRYLFLHVPETELASLGINIATYSEYVRQGFFYLLIAAGISTTIISFVIQKIHEIGGKYATYLKAAIVALNLETQLLLVSDAKRLSLYQQAHGLSEIRIWGVIFLLWLSLILLTLLYATVRKMKPVYYFSAILAITLCALFSLNVIPIDNLIATKFPPTINHKIDNEYISGLSADASESWPAILEETSATINRLDKVTMYPSDEEVRLSYESQRILDNLIRRVFYLDRKYNPDPKKYIKIPIDSYKFVHIPPSTWQAFNNSEYHAFRLIQANKKDFEKLDTLYKTLYSKTSLWYNYPKPSTTPTPEETSN